MPYTLPAEQKLDIELSALLSEWKKIVCTEKTSSELFVEDGFYPFFYSAACENSFYRKGSAGNGRIELCKNSF